MSVTDQIPISGRKLRERIDASGLTQRALAAAAGLDKAQLSRLCNGKQRALAASAAAGLALVLRCSVDDLRPDPGEESGGNAGALMTGVHGVDKSGVVMLPLRWLRLADANPRRSYDEAAIAELAESIAAHGVLQNLTVLSLPGGGAPIYHDVIAGGRRLRALQTLAETGRWDAEAPLVPCRILDADAVQARTLALVENLQRQDLTPMEEAEAFSELRKLGLSTEDIAERTHRKRSFVYDRLSLLRLTEPAREALAQGRLNLEQARELARAPRWQQKEILRRPTLPNAESIRFSVRTKHYPLSVAAFALEEYVTQGGLIIDPEEEYGEAGAEKVFGDVELFTKLQRQAAVERVTELQGQGWAWAEFARSPIPLWQQEGYTECDDQSRAGCLVWIGTDGRLYEKCGLLKPETPEEYENQEGDAGPVFTNGEEVADSLAGEAAEESGEGEAPAQERGEREARAAAAGDVPAGDVADAPQLDLARIALSLSFDRVTALRLLVLELFGVPVPLAIGWGAGTHTLRWIEELRSVAGDGATLLDAERAWRWTRELEVRQLLNIVAAVCADALTAEGDGIDGELVRPMLEDLARQYGLLPAAPAEATPPPEPPE